RKAQQWRRAARASRGASSLRAKRGGGSRRGSGARSGDEAAVEAAPGRAAAGGVAASPAQCGATLLCDGFVDVVFGVGFRIGGEAVELRGDEALVLDLVLAQLFEEEFDLRVGHVAQGFGEEGLSLLLAVEGDVQGLAARHEGAGLLVLGGLDVEEHGAVDTAGRAPAEPRPPPAPPPARPLPPLHPLPPHPPPPPPLLLL